MSHLNHPDWNLDYEAEADENVPFVPVTTTSLNMLAPLPEHTGATLHPAGEEWYRALVTFDVEVLSQPRPSATGAGMEGGR